MEQPAYARCDYTGAVTGLLYPLAGWIRKHALHTTPLHTTPVHQPVVWLKPRASGLLTELASPNPGGIELANLLH